MRPQSYMAFEEKNGTYSILDVPIFSEVPKGEKNAPEDIGRAWLEKAIDAAAKLEKDNGYLPPLHIGHHKPGESVEGAGHFRLRRIRTMQLDGTERCVLTADLIGLQKPVFDSIMAGSFPYRSVEISDWSEPRINHCALLSHQEPFFKFPLLNGTTIRLETTGQKAMARTECEGKKAVAFFSEGEPTEAIVPKLKIETKRPTKADLAERIQKLLPMFAEEDESGEQLTAEEEELDAALAELDAIESGEKKPTEAEFDALVAKLEELADHFEDDTEEEGSDDDPTPAELGNPKPTRESKKQAAKLAALEDKVELMEATATAEKTATQLVAKARADLAGYFLTPKMLKRIETFAETGDAELLDLYVENHKEIGTKEPITLAAEQAGSDPALKDLNLTPETSERAIQLAADYEIAHRRGFTTCSKKDFIALNLEAEAASAQ